MAAAAPQAQSSDHRSVLHATDSFVHHAGQHTHPETLNVLPPKLICIAADAGFLVQGRHHCSTSGCKDVTRVCGGCGAGVTLPGHIPDMAHKVCGGGEGGQHQVTHLNVLMTSDSTPPIATAATTSTSTSAAGLLLLLLEWPLPMRLLLL
jgi:hypothetical protein